MRAVTSLIRTGEDRTSSVFVPVPEPRGRPPTRYRVRIRSPADVERARDSDIPVYLLDAGIVTALGYPIEFPAELIVAHSVRGAVETTYETVPFVSDSAVRSPRFEDVALAMLTINRLAARAILDRNVERLDRTYLLKRILQENLEERATSVRLRDLVPSLPRVGRELPRAAIQRQLRKNLPTGRLP